MTSDARPPAYRIHTSRLVLRCWSPGDAPLLMQSIHESLEHLRPWMPWIAQEPETLDEKVQRLRRMRAAFDRDEDYVYGVFDRAETKVLGGTGLHTRVGPNAREIGYWIHVDHLRRGYARELSAALTKVAFLVDRCERVEIHCDPANVASARVPEALGFVHEATLGRRVRTADGAPRDSMIWTMFADRLASSPCASAEVEAFDAAGRRLL